MRTRWGVMISGNGSTLQSILDCADLCDVAVVISSRPLAFGILRARRAGVPVEVLPTEFQKREKPIEAEEWILKTLEKYRVQKLFLAGYMKIVSPGFIKAFSDRCGKNIFNIHPSLLPKYKGLDAFQAAMNAGDSVAG